MFKPSLFDIVKYKGQRVWGIYYKAKKLVPISFGGVASDTYYGIVFMVGLYKKQNALTVLLKEGVKNEEKEREENERRDKKYKKKE